jgi:hypothetical protein
VQTDDPALVLVKQIHNAWWQDRAAEGPVHGRERLHLDIEKVKGLILVQVLQEMLQPGPGNGPFFLTDNRAFCGGIKDLAMCLQPKAFADDLTKSRSAGALAGDDHGIGQVGRSGFGVRVPPPIVRNPSSKTSYPVGPSIGNAKLPLPSAGRYLLVPEWGFSGEQGE